MGSDLRNLLTDPYGSYIGKNPVILTQIAPFH